MIDGDQVEKKEYLTNYMKIVGKYRIRSIASIAKIPPKPSATWKLYDKLLHKAKQKTNWKTKSS